MAEWLRVLILLTQSFNHLTSGSGVGSSLTWGTHETSHVLLAGVPSVFSRVL